MLFLVFIDIADIDDVLGVEVVELNIFFEAIFILSAFFRA